MSMCVCLSVSVCLSSASATSSTSRALEIHVLSSDRSVAHHVDRPDLTSTPVGGAVLFRGGYTRFKDGVSGVVCGGDAVVVASCVS